MTNPWADPSTPTEPGVPYAGPPPTAPQPCPSRAYPYGGVPGYGWPQAGYPGSAPGWPAWGWPPPPRPRKPAQLIGAAVLAFVQTAIALVGTLYTYMLTSLAGLTVRSGTEFGPGLGGLAAEGEVLAVIQLLSVLPLVAGGILALTRRTRAAWLILVASFVVQVLIALYWALRLSGAIGVGFDADTPPLAGFTLFFAAAPLVGVGLVAAGPGRRWFTEAREA